MTTTSSDELDAELTNLEQSLETPSRGRAVFNSIASSLSALGRRIDDALTSSTNSVNQRLRDRLSTAQLAHSSRRPLGVVRQAQQSGVNSSSTPVRPSLPANPSRGRTPILASRTRSVGNLNVNCTTTPAAAAASPATTPAVDCTEDDDESDELFSKELHEQAKKRARTQKPAPPIADEEKAAPKIPTKVLLTRNQSHDMVNSSIVSVLSQDGGLEIETTLSTEETPEVEEEGLPGSLVYSWGLEGLLSLHDDDSSRTPANSKLTKTSRLGRPGAPVLVSVASGDTHTACATASGSVYVVGKNEKGCVDPSKRNTARIVRPTLLESLGGQTILHLSCGLDHTAAVTTNGTVLTWGSNQQGQLGHRSKSNDAYCAPQAMVLGGGKQAAQVACGHYFTLVLTNRMCVLACGVDYIAPNGSDVPISIPALQGLPLVFVAAGHNHAVVLTSSGTAYAWGLNDSGCCGRSYPNQFAVPIELQVPDVSNNSGNNQNTMRTSSTSSSSCSLTTNSQQHHPFRNWTNKWHPPNNAIMAASPNKNNNALSNPDCVMSIDDQVAIVHAACGAHHTVLVTRSGRLLVCGNNGQGQLGLPLSRQVVSPPEPVHPPAGAYFVSAEAGISHTLVLDNRGDVWQMGGLLDNNNSIKEGLHCLLQGKNILTICAGGDGNNIGIAQGAATPRGSMMRKRLFAIAGDNNRHKNLLSMSPANATKNSSQERSLAIADNLDELVDSLAVQSSKGSTALSVGGGSRELATATEIANRAEELLQNPSVMNSLFFGPRELDAMYTKLMSIGSGNDQAQQTILTAMERGIKHGLESLLPENPDHARMIYPEAVRCLLVYIRFFDRPSLAGVDDTDADSDIFERFDARGTLISSLMETILSLPFEGYKAFLKWATSIYTGDLYIKMLVQPLLFQLEKSCRVRVDDDQVMHTSLSIGAVPLIVSVLQWLYNASERLGIAKPEEFACQVFDKIPVEALYHDLSLLKKARNSKQGVTHFHICESPFLFSPATKRNLLKMENQIEMYKAACNDGVTLNLATGEVSIDAFFKLEIDRNDMLHQTLAAIKKAKPSDLRKSLRVKFRGEEGVDAGGVTKEFFQLLSEELFDVSKGMWTDKYGDDVTWFNSNCMWEDVGFELTGILVGLALYNSVLLDVHFPMAVYRKLLGYPLGLEDMVDMELKRGLQQLLDYEGDDVEDIFCLTFEVSWTDDLGEERKRELKPGGSNIPVTSENKEEYVRLYVSWLLVDSIYPQWASFETGVLRVLEGSSIGLCRPEEVELLVVGSPDLDFDALEANTQYEGGYDENSETVKCFWRFIKGLDCEAQTNFLKFATGSPKAPIGGLGKLNFKVQRAGPDSPQLPTSHTCFNTLILPDYGTDEKLSNLLGRAIVECEGFGLE